MAVSPISAEYKTVSEANTYILHSQFSILNKRKARDVKDAAPYILITKH